MAINVREIHDEYLRDPAFAAGYLNDAIGEESPAEILLALRFIAEAQEGGVSALAGRLRMTPEAVYEMLSIKGNHGKPTLRLTDFAKVVRGLGLKLTAQADAGGHGAVKIAHARKAAPAPKHAKRYATTATVTVAG